MATKEGAQLDTLPSQMYGWDGSAPKRISTDASGNFYTVDSYGMLIPRHDKIVVDESSAPGLTTITYYLSSIERGTKTITVSGTTTTIEMTYV